MKKKPGLFIGSARESIKFANALLEELKDVALTEVWDQNFRSGHFTLEELIRKTNEFEFAAFILGQEDQTTSKGTITLSPRDNVVYEAGLFSGRLGLDKVFLLINVHGTKKPSDWEGLTNLEYDPEQDEKNAIHKAAVRIRKQIKEWRLMQASSLELQIPGAWWQYVINSDEGSVLSAMKISRSGDGSLFKINGNSWSNEGKRKAEYWSRAAAFDLEDRKLFYYWEGQHPYDKTIPKFFGTGEIQFEELRSASVSKANGWYSSYALDQLSKSVRKSTIYIRAIDEDLRILEGDELPAIKELITRQINKLKGISNNQV